MKINNIENTCITCEALVKDECMRLGTSYQAYEYNEENEIEGFYDEKVYATGEDYEGGVFYVTTPEEFGCAFYRKKK